MRDLAALVARVASLERMMANAVRPGRVEQVDLEKKAIRIRLSGEGNKTFLSPWVRYAQVAGGLKVHTPPTVGQQMTLFSPAGVLSQGLALPLGWSDDEPSPSDDGDPVLTFGQVRVELHDAEAVITVGETSLTLTPTSAVLSVGSSEVLTLGEGAAELKAGEVRTVGVTKLNGGTREVVYKGATDSRMDVNNVGAGPGVLV